MITVRLVAPSLDRLPDYVAALQTGWSPNNERDVSGEQLALYRREPGALLHELTRQDGTITLGDGQVVPRLPSRVFWLDDDGAFCGQIGLRWQPGSEGLPPYVSGHVGYAVVPWQRRRGHATRALALILPVAREAGLHRVVVTCFDDNEASRRVILANGGTLVGSGPYAGGTRLVFHIDLDRPVA